MKRTVLAEDRVRGDSPVTHHLRAWLARSSRVVRVLSSCASGSNRDTQRGRAATARHLLIIAR